MYKTSGKGSAAKKTAWHWFSKFIRLRDCLATTGAVYRCRCVTCGEVVPSDLLHAGHGIPGRTAGILFDETLCRGQCARCNLLGGGEREKYKSVLVAEHGEAWYELKLAARKSGAFYTDDDYRRIAKEYREKYNDILRRAE